MAVARSTDAQNLSVGHVSSDFENARNHFNDKPMITADANLGSPFRDNVYIAWTRLQVDQSVAVCGWLRQATKARPSQRNASMTFPAQENPLARLRRLGQTEKVYVAWNDYAANAIVF